MKLLLQPCKIQKQLIILLISLKNFTNKITPRWKSPMLLLWFLPIGKQMELLLQPCKIQEQFMILVDSLKNFTKYNTPRLDTQNWLKKYQNSLIQQEPFT